ncbi:MAG: cyclic nucleotide-binding domain-containing protein [Chloroflexi bacterium]|nr:cyclic nucleotide-binding domain-containing protein [Chloroflexota bacterium]
MSERSVWDLLVEHPFTSDLSDEDRRALADLATIKRYQPDELIIQEGRPATTFFLIADGLVAIELFLPDRGVRRLQTAGAGSAVGWSWMLAPSRWEFDVRALEPTTAVALNGERLRALFDRECCLGLQLTRKLLAVVAGRLKATRLQLLDVYGPPKEAAR